MWIQTEASGVIPQSKFYLFSAPLLKRQLNRHLSVGVVIFRTPIYQLEGTIVFYITFDESLNLLICAGC
jgi:hypothetical protein